MRIHRRTARGVSLVEVLVTITVIGILTAITIPVLRSMAMRGHDAKNQSSLRSTHQHFRIYANDNDDYFVNAGRPERPGLPIVVDFGPGNGWMGFPYLLQKSRWPAVLGNALGEAFPTWHSTHEGTIRDRDGRPGNITNPQYVFETSLIYSQAMLADPFRFTSADSFHDYSAYRMVRWSEVSFPSSKGLMIDMARPQKDHNREMRNIAFADGSVALVDLFSTGSFPSCRNSFMQSP